MGIQPMKWMRRWHPTAETTWKSKLLAHGYTETKKYRKWLDLNHEGVFKWEFDDEQCVVSPTGKESCERTDWGW